MSRTHYQEEVIQLKEISQEPSFNIEEELILKEKLLDQFFVVGLQKQAISKCEFQLEVKEELSTVCSHKLCSLCPPFKNQVLQAYPECEQQENLAQNIKDFCFPVGLRVCVNQSKEKKLSLEESSLYKPKIIYPILTNAERQHVYMTGLIIYENFTMEEFE